MIISKYAIYKAINRNKEVIYVGRTNNLKNRMNQHKKNSEWWQYANNILVAECENKTESIVYEQYYINKYIPKYNKSDKRFDDVYGLKGIKEHEFNFDFLKDEYKKIIIKKNKNMTYDELLKLNLKYKKQIKDFEKDIELKNKKLEEIDLLKNENIVLKEKNIMLKEKSEYLKIYKDEYFKKNNSNNLISNKDNLEKKDNLIKMLKLNKKDLENRVQELNKENYNYNKLYKDLKCRYKKDIELWCFNVETLKQIIIKQENVINNNQEYNKRSDNNVTKSKQKFKSWWCK